MFENIRLSLKGIVSHKMRSVLTMLGVIIGIASIIIIVAIIQGATQGLKDMMIGNDTNTVTLNLYDVSDPYSEYSTSYGGTIQGITTISKSCLRAVNEIEGVESITPIYHNPGNVTTSYNSKESQGDTYGVEKDFFGVNGLYLISGRTFVDEDYENKKNVAVLSAETAGQLFTNEDPVGKTVKINSDMFVVIGVVEKNRDYSKINSLSDYYLRLGFESNEVYVPATSWELVGGFDDIQSLVIKIDNLDEIVNVSKKAADILNSAITSEQYEYKSSSIGQDSEDLEELTSIAYLLLVGIASISLLVGGIGVMNIMLVSVTERTKEIGLKKALGAKRHVILGQFLTEAVVLTGLGGVIGVVIGIVVSKSIGMIAGLTIVISMPVILLAVGFSMFVGIVFGLIPSVKASKLDPIDALRYE